MYSLVDIADDSILGLERHLTDVLVRGSPSTYLPINKLSFKAVSLASMSISVVISNRSYQPVRIVKFVRVSIVSMLEKGRVKSVRIVETSSEAWRQSYR